MMTTAAADSAIDWYSDLLPGPAFARELHRLRDQAPVVPVRGLGGALEVFYIVGHEALSEAFRDGERFPPGLAYQIISQPYIGRTFMSMDEPEHNVWRPPMTPVFRRTAIEAMDDAALTGAAHALIDRIEAGGGGDLTRAYTRRFAFAMICTQLGLPRDREAEYYDWSMDLMFGGRDLAASRAADAKLTGLMLPELARRKEHPTGDVISRWTQLDVEGEPIDDEMILSHIRLFFTAGATTTSDALGNAVYTLLSEPDAWRRCCEAPDCIEDAVEELLRLVPPVAAQPRFVRADAPVEFYDVSMPANASVLFGIAAANRDPDVFPDPDRFDIDRRAQGILTFGPGLRTCPGMHFARKNLRVGLRVLAERLPNLSLADAEASQPRGILLRGPAILACRW